MSVLKMYFAADDVAVSVAPTETNAVEFTLRADLEESDTVRLYAKCDAGYQATLCSVEGAGTSVARWELNPDTGASVPTEGWVAAGTGIDLATVTTANKYFWVRASAVTADVIGKDTTVTLTLEGVGEAV